MNLVFLDQKLHIQARKPFLLAREVFDEVLINQNDVANLDQTATKLRTVNRSTWYRVRESNP